MTTKTIKELEKEAIELYIEATRLYIKSFGDGGVKPLDSLPGQPPPPPPPPPH